MNIIKQYASNLMYGGILYFYLPLKYILYKFKRDKKIKWEKLSVCGIEKNNNQFFILNNKLDVAERVSTMMLLVVLNLIASFISIQFYVATYGLLILYILWLTGKNIKYSIFDFVIMLLGLTILCFLVLACQQGGWQSILLLGSLLLLPGWCLSKHQLDNGTYKYAIVWVCTSAYVIFFMSFVFGIIDYPYLKDLNIEDLDIRSKIENKAYPIIILYFVMLGYAANMSYYQSTIQDKINLLMHDSGDVMLLQLIVIGAVIGLMFFLVPRLIRDLYKDFFK